MPVTVHAQDFPGSVQLTVAFADLVGDIPQVPLGIAMTDPTGQTTFTVRVPVDAPFGEASLRVSAGPGCSADAFLSVVGSLEAIAIDDDTVKPGQAVTITAGGFEPSGPITVMLDGDAFDALSTGRDLGSTRANDVGAVRVDVRIPRGTSPGRHFLTVNGSSFDGARDLVLSVDVSVEP